MRNAMYAIAVATLLGGLTGCTGDLCNHRWPWEHAKGAQCGDGGCKSCGEGQGREGALAARRNRPEHCPAGGDGLNGPAGPATGAVAYPYYTTRGPRDYLNGNPPSIGP